MFCFAQSIDYSKGANSAKKYQYFTDYQLAMIQEQQQLQLKQQSNQNQVKKQTPVKNNNSNAKFTPDPDFKLTPGTPDPSKLAKRDYQNLLKHSAELSGCWDKAGEIYQLDPWLLVAIAKVESSFNNKALNDKNNNKTTDYGMMQINSIWLPTLSKMGISKEDLFRPCVSVFVGAWIAKQGILKLGYNAQGIGAYNAGMGASANRDRLRQAYADKVFAAYKQLVKDFHPNLLSQM